MAKNKMSDVRDHLVAMMESLNDESTNAEQMDQVIRRAQAMQGLSKAYTENARLTFQVAKALNEGDVHKDDVPVAFVVNNSKALEHKQQ